MILEMKGMGLLVKDIATESAGHTLVFCAGCFHPAVDVIPSTEGKLGTCHVVGCLFTISLDPLLNCHHRYGRGLTVIRSKRSSAGILRHLASI